MPVTTGLKAATFSPRSASAAQMAAASTVLPTPVSVAVTKIPRTARDSTQAELGRFGEPVEDLRRATTCGDRLGLRLLALRRRHAHGPRDHARRPTQLRARMRGHHGYPQAGAAVRDGRRADRL